MQTDLRTRSIVGSEVGRSSWAIVLRRSLGIRRTQVGIAITSVIVLIAMFGPFFAPQSPTAFVDLPFASPSDVAPLGTDHLGRDVLSRFLSGGYTLLGVAALSALLGVGLGTIIGLTAGYSKTWRGQFGMRALDVLLAFPNIVLALLFLSILGPKAWLIVVLVGVAQAPRVARVMRAATIEVVERDFVRAAEAVGIPRWRILLEDVLPNVTGPLMVESGIRFTYAIGVVSALSFLGFGLPPPTPDWGVMVNENRTGIIVQPWTVLVPIAAIGLITVGTNLIADGFARAAGRVDGRVYI